MLVPIRKCTVATRLQIEFQRQTYFFQASVRFSLASVYEVEGIDIRIYVQNNGGPDAFVLAPCPIDLPLSHYAASSGLVSTSYASVRRFSMGGASTIEQLHALWGSNVLDVPVPSIFTMMRAQMLSPLVMFQVRCFFFLLFMLLFYHKNCLVDV